MNFSQDRKNYFHILLSMGHENSASTSMMQESLSFVFQTEGFKRKKAYGLHVFLSQHLLMKLFDKLLKLKTFQKQPFSCSLIKWLFLKHKQKLQKKNLLRSTVFSNFTKNELIHFEDFAKITSYACLHYSNFCKKHLSMTSLKMNVIPSGIYLFKVSNRYTRTSCKIR